MRTKLFRQLVLALAGMNLVPAIGHCERLTFGQVPQRVRDAIRAEAGPSPITNVDRSYRNGVPSYAVTYRRGTQDMLMVFDAQGNAMNLQGTPLPPITTAITFSELPQVVQEMVRARGGDAVVNSVLQEVRDGVANYTVSLNVNGTLQQLVLAQDGRILRDLPPVAVGNAGPAQSGSAISTYANLAGPVRLNSQQTISVAELPTAVQSVVNQEVGAVTIDEIHRGLWNGKPVYQVTFRPNRQRVDLQIDAAGNIMYDPRAHPHLGSDTDLNARAQALYPNLKQPVPLAAAQTTRLVDLPGEVQTAIKTQLGAAVVQNLQWGIWNGQRIYSVGITWNGQQAALQLDDYGNVVFDPRTQVGK